MFSVWGIVVVCITALVARLSDYQWCLLPKTAGASGADILSALILFGLFLFRWLNVGYLGNGGSPPHHHRYRSLLPNQPPKGLPVLRGGGRRAKGNLLQTHHSMLLFLRELPYIHYLHRSEQRRAKMSTHPPQIHLWVHSLQLQKDL